MHSRFFLWIFITVIVLSAFPLSAQIRNSIIDEWLVLGTFSCDSIHLAAERAFISDESGQMPKAGDVDTTSGLKWSRVAAGHLNFNAMDFVKTEYAIVYACTYIYAPTERNVRLLVGSDDGVVMWLNDKQVHNHLIYRSLKRGEDRLTVRLAAGWNRLLCKVFNGSGDFGLVVDLVSDQNEAFKDLSISSRKPKDLKLISPGAYPFISGISLAPSYMSGRQRIFPLTVDIKNLGQTSNQLARLIFDARGLFSRQENFRLEETTEVVIPLTARNIQSIMTRRAGVSTYIGGRPYDIHVFHIQPDMVLKSLFHSDNLPIEAAVIKTMYTDLEENIKWYNKLAGKDFELKNQILETGVRHALNGKWTDFLKTLEVNFKEIKEFATLIKQDTLHFIGQSHIDMAWLWRWPETVEVTRETFQAALDFFREIPGYKYIQSQAVAFRWIEEKHPELFKAIQDAVNRGRFHIVGGMWVEPDLNIPNGESLVRQLFYGKRYFRDKFGVDCVTGYTPDTFGYTWNLPQILKKAGFKYFVTTKIRWNDTAKFPHSLFYWISPDGSDILTCFPMALNVNCDLNQMADHLLAYKEEGFFDLPVLYGVGDHGGGPTRQHFSRIKKMQSLAAYPTAYYNDLDSYMERAERKYADLPRYQDELYLEYHRGTLTTQAEIKKRNRRCEVALEAAEKFATFSGIEYPAAELEKAWKLTLFNQFHDILPGSSIPEVYIDAKNDYDQVERITNDVISRSLSEIAKQIDLKGKDVPVVVFNSLSWNRTDLITVQLETNQTIKEVRHANGDKIPFQQNGPELIFVADVPQSGYTTYWLREGKPGETNSVLTATQTKMENDYFLVGFNPGNGNIKRMYDKRFQVEVITPGQQANVLQFWEDKPKQYDAWNIGYTGKFSTCEKIEGITVLESGPVRAVVRFVRSYGDSKFTQDYVLYADLPRLDIRTQADWHEKHTLLKAAFPVNVEADYATYDIAYGSIRRTTHPETPAEKAKFEVSAHKYVDLSTVKYGVSLLNDCKYGHDIKDNIMRITLLRAPLTPTPRERPANYSNPYADQGLHEFVYALYPHQGDCRSSFAARRGYELNYPLLPLVSEEHKGKLSLSYSFINIDADNVVVSAVKQAENSQATIVRLYELYGKSTKVKLAFTSPVQNAHEVNLMEEKGKELSVERNTVNFSIEPYSIFSLMVE